MVVADGVVMEMEPPSAVTSPMPLLRVSVRPAPPVAVQARLTGAPMVLVEGVAVKALIAGAGLMVTEPTTGTWRSLTTRTLRTVAPAPRLKVTERELRPAVMAPLVMDQT